MKNIRELYEEAQAEKAAIIKKIAPLREKEAELMAEIEPLESDLRKTRKAIAQAEKDGNLADVSRTVAALAPAQKRTKAETGGIGVKVE